MNKPPVNEQLQGGVSLPVLIVVSCGLIWGTQQLPSPLIGGEWGTLSAVVHLLAGIAVLTTVSRLLQIIALILDWRANTRTTGHAGQAGWASYKDIKKHLTRNKTGAFWGMLPNSKTGLFFGYDSCAMTFAPSGSGKGIYTVVTNILSILHSKICPDFKGELACMLKKTLEARGEVVRILNAGGLFTDILGETDRYNPLDLITDDLTQAGGIRDVSSDLQGMCEQLLPDAETGRHMNSFFDDGARDLIALAIVFEVMVDLYDADLSAVALLIENRQRFEDMCRWVVGVDIEDKPHPDGAFPIEKTEWAQNHDAQDVEEFAKFTRAIAHNLLTLMSGSESRTYDSFATSAQQALRPFAFGRLAPAMKKSTFRMSDLKEGKKATTLFIVSDASRMEVFEKYTGLMLYCCTTVLKRHENKKRLVFLIADETTNYLVKGLIELLTWCRSFGIRVHIIFQELKAFERKYGEGSVNTLLSETEVKQILPHQRSPEALELIERLLGDQPIMTYNASYNAGEEGHGQTLTEAGRPLANSDEIRRTTQGILFVRQLKPILFEPVSYAEIHPWRDQVGINPFHGKPFRKKIKLRL